MDTSKHNFLRDLLFSVLASTIACAVFLIIRHLRGVAPGYPLDDAWIHQTYAKNLGLRGEFSFVPGHPSAGSTAPLWTLLLALGYGLRIPAMLWTLVIGVLSLIANAMAAATLARALFPNVRLAPIATGITVALEWHQVWGAVSSMETVLFTAGVMALLALAVIWGKAPPTPAQVFGSGLGIGLLALVRPEGILLSGILGLALLLRFWGNWRALIQRGILLGVGMVIPLVPYFVANRYLSGTLFPNTFYAKQQEYRLLYAASFPKRMLRLLPPLLAGPLVILLPAAVWTWQSLKHKAHHWLPLLWVVGTWILYAWRLPVTYQHGRYLMPIIPPLLVYGIEGLLLFWQQAGGRLAWLLSRSWLGATALVTLAFLVIGANAFATDVAIINGEMVDVARWVNKNTPSDAQIAAHDIGALGYFAERPLLDLAGLISPEVIPFIRDESQLLQWMQAENVSYIVTFPSWYPTLTTDPRLELVYQTDTEITRASGQDNMAVYKCHWKQ